MRVLEHGLHELARSVAIPMAPTVELENWKNIIDQLASEIGKRRKMLTQAGKSHPRDEELRRLSEVALQLGYFKDAWRNYVSHARKTYDADEARSVWNHAQEFMRTLAETI